MTKNSGGLTCAVVIVTYRRSDVLLGTLQYWDVSARPPDQFIVVDASPDASSTAARATTSYPNLFRAPGSAYLTAPVPSITRQRNLALDHVHADVVVFVDDETHPRREFLDCVMDVYEADREGVVGAVGGVDAAQLRPRGRVRAAIRGSIGRFARHFATTRDQALPPHVRVPPGIGRLGATRVRDIQGNKMSFRTAIVRRERFDAAMLRYGYCEDLDISIRVGREHAVVRASRAIIDHPAVHEARVGSAQLFLVKWVNPAYLTEKLFPFEANRRPLRRLFRIARLHALLTPAGLVRREERRRRQRLFDVAEAMMAFVRNSSRSDLAERFAALQNYIFNEATADEIDRRASFDVWKHEWTAGRSTFADAEGQDGSVAVDSRDVTVGRSRTSDDQRT